MHFGDWIVQHPIPKGASNLVYDYRLLDRRISSSRLTEPHDGAVGYWGYSLIRLELILKRPIESFWDAGN